jgi:hypothetical protein
MPMLLREINQVSRRTAFVNDDGNLVDFSLNPTPEDLVSLLPKGNKWTSKDFDWVLKDSVWLYRHLRSAADEIKLMSDFPCVDQDIKPLEFEKPPQFKLFWADSGNSAVLYLNGEPWAFICAETHQGYSKGMLSGDSGSEWDQELFEKTFLK